MQFATQLISSITIAATLGSAFVVPRQATPAPGNYTLTFSNQTAAVQGTDFITFALLATTSDCTAFCDSVATCGFANSYHDNNGKGGSPLLTCSLYLGCHGVGDLQNTGGQTQPDGSVNFITDSSGWCKIVAPTEPTTTAPGSTVPTGTAAPTSTAPVETSAPAGTSTHVATSTPAGTSTHVATSTPVGTSTHVATSAPAGTSTHVETSATQATATSPAETTAAPPTTETTA